MKKVLYVATVVKTHIMEFHIPYLKMFKEMGWETAVAAYNDYDNKEDCIIPYCDKYYDLPFVRNPVNLKNILAYKQLKRLINTEKYDIIHCHTPVGGMLTRLAAVDARKKGSIVFYTAHGFHFYTGSPFINWIVYYPVEKWLARKTDVLVTITKEDYLRAKKFNINKTVYIPGVGIDLNRFQRGKSCIDGDTMKMSLGIPKNVKVLLSVGEINKNKNHKIVLEALSHFPDVWYVLCGQGPLIDEYKKLSVKLGISNRVIFTGYRTDIENYYNIADVFVFPSIREGLPVALMEAIATEIVCVASRNRGTDDLLYDSKLRFNAHSTEELIKKLHIALFENCSEEIITNKKHLQRFAQENVLLLMRQYYQECNYK